MNEYKKSIKGFITNYRYMLPTLFTAVLSFGFFITNSVISTDDTAFAVYMEDYEFIRQGRFGSLLIQQIFPVYEYTPFFVDFISIVLLFVAALLFAALFKVVSKDKLHPFSYVLFSCLMMSYPLINEAFVYMCLVFTISLSFVLVAAALICIQSFFDTRKWYHLLISVLLLILAVSLYESFAAVYICGVFAILIIKFFYGDERDKTFKTVFLKGIVFLAVLAVAIVLEACIAKAFLYFMKLETSRISENALFWTLIGKRETLLQLCRTSLVQILFYSFWYPPITVYVFSIGLAVLLSVISAVKQKKVLIVLLFFGLVLSTVILSIVQGIASPARTCQAYYIFTAFVIMLAVNFILCMEKKIVLKKCVMAAACLLIFHQAHILHQYFYLEYQRSVEERNIMSAVADRLNEHYDMSKPVVFKGSVSLEITKDKRLRTSSDGFRLKLVKKIASVMGKEQLGKEVAGAKFVKTNVNSTINWGKGAFGNQDQLYIYFRMVGYYFNEATPEMQKEADGYLSQMDEWPAKNSILETDEYIIVNF